MKFDSWPFVARAALFLQPSPLRRQLTAPLQPTQRLKTLPGPVFEGSQSLSPRRQYLNF